MTKKQIQAQVDKAVLAEYPNARKIDSALLDELYYEDGTRGIAYYIIQELPDADEFGRNEDLPEDFEVEDGVALTVFQHKKSGRVFFSILNEYGESHNSWGETDGEVILDSAELNWETAIDHELN